jgi:hypothetical protein
MASVHALATTARRVQQQLQLPIVAVGALEVCDHTLSLSIHQLGAARADLQLLEAAAWKKVGTTSLLDDVKTRVTAAMEFHTTCIDTLMESGELSMMPDDQSHETSVIFQVKDRTDQLLSNAIAFINAFSTHGNHLPSWSSPVLSDISRLFLHPTTSLFSYPSPGTQCSRTAQQDSDKRLQKNTHMLSFSLLILHLSQLLHCGFCRSSSQMSRGLRIFRVG